MTSALYPEPPQLSVVIYSERSRRDAFAAVCRCLEEAGCTRSGYLQSAPGDLAFASISDLADSLRTDRVAEGDWSLLVSGGYAGRRVVRAGFRHRSLGTVVVEYMSSSGADRNPLAVTMSAGDLGTPWELLGSGGRRKGRSRASECRAILRAVSQAADALYGGVVVESWLPTPGELQDGELLPSELFVSSHLREIGHTGRRLRSLYEGGSVDEWAHGDFCAAWAPFSSRDIAQQEIVSLRESASRVVANALKRR